MDFGAFPPEFNSARMYAGPGPGSMLAAATAWEGLAAELRSAAGAYRSAISGLTVGRWLGPSSLAMASAFAPYMAWTAGAAARAEEAASHARFAVEAFDAAYAMTVPPALVTANRVQLATLVATNWLGQNAPAIAATEAAYGEMWAQDAAAMYEYATNSAQAAMLTVFNSAPEVVNPAGAAGQATAVSEAAGGSTAQQLSLAGVMSSLSSALQSLTTPATASAASTQTIWGTLLGTSTGGTSLSSFMSNFEQNLPAILPGYLMVAATPLYGLSSVLGMAQTLQSLGTAAVVGAADAAGSVAAEAAGAVDAASGGVLASMGQAASLGPLAVPASWTSVIPSAHLTSAGAVLPNGALGSSGSMPPSLLGGLPRAGANGPQAPGPRYGLVPTVMAQPPSAGYGASVI